MKLNFHSYTIILTHDVDHLALKNYSLFSKMTASFFKRSLWNNLIRLIKGDIALKDYLDGVKWVVLYFFVKLGVVTDPWEKAIDDIMELEKSIMLDQLFSL